MALLLLLAGVFAGCSSDTAILIYIDTELRVPEELNGVRIKVDSDVKSLLDKTFSIPTQDDMPTTYTVTNETDKEVWVTVYVYGLLGTDQVAQDSKRVLFVKGKTLDVYIYLRRAGPGEKDGGTDAARDTGIAHDAGWDSGRDGGVDADATDVGEARSDGGDEVADGASPRDSGSDAPDVSDVSDSSFDDAQDVSYPTDVEDVGDVPGAGEDAGTDAGDDAGTDAGCNKTPQPTACKSKCGEVGDGCGGTYACGDCSDGFSCAQNECVCPSGKLCTGTCCPNAGDACHNSQCCTPQCAGKCGGASDACGGQCNNCGASELCEGTVCVHCGDRDEKCCQANACNGSNVCKDGRCVPTDCTGLPDFTACDAVTTPDRRYDICVSGTCVSPGCGDATCNPPGPHFPIPDTGQRKCYDGTAEIACPTGSGTPCNTDGTPQYCGQDAQYGWDTTHQQTERFSVSKTVPDEPVVTDNVTGLVWQGCPAGLKGADCSANALERKPWDAALAYCDGLVWGGRSGWRLPDLYEVISSEAFSSKEPSIDTTAFPGTPSEHFWTNTIFQADTGYPWFVRFDTGYSGGDLKSAAKNVRCVSGAPVPISTRFTRTVPVQNEPVVLDHLSGLEWQGCVASLLGENCDLGLDQTKSWTEALAYCESLDWGGHNDWRLPDIEEAFSIVDESRSKPAINPAAFPNTPGLNSIYFWTSTPSVTGSGYSWAVHSAAGMIAPGSVVSKIHTRCVRGQP